MPTDHDFIRAECARYPDAPQPRFTRFLRALVRSTPLLTRAAMDARAHTLWEESR